MGDSSKDTVPLRSPDITAASSIEVSADVLQVQDEVRATVPSLSAQPQLHHISGTYSEPDTPDKYYDYYPASRLEHDKDTNHLQHHMAKKPKLAHGINQEQRPASGIPSTSSGNTQPPFSQPAGTFPSGQIPFQSLPPLCLMLLRAVFTSYNG